MKRIQVTDQIDFAFEVTRCVAILGPRQCGKTTEAREYAKRQPDFARQNYFDLENSRDVERLQDPLLSLSSLNGLGPVDN